MSPWCTSTSEWRVELATPADDAALRRLVADNPIPGSITLGFEREPSYFLGCGTMGHFWQVAIARRLPGGDVAAVASRATRPLFVNGHPEEVGYLGQLRVDGPYRGRWLTARFLRGLEQLHADGRVAGYLATIIEENHQAYGLFVSRPRRHFPTFREVTRLCTLALLVQAPQPERHQDYEIDRGSAATLGEIVAFLRQHGSARQFFPAYTESDFLDTPLTRDFRVEDFVVARHVAYHSRLYTVSPKGEEAFHDRLDRRLPYVEIAAL
ncbi:MAG: hypothetical protein HY332_04815 [Chloroflexi bacterium]|nr:hypothetical protein [Chloroflexota bacterium]